MMNSKKVVTPVNPGSSPGGVQMVCNCLKRLDSGFRRNDGLRLRFSPRRRIVTLRAGGQPVGLTGRLPARRAYSSERGQHLRLGEKTVFCDFLRVHQE